ncbi:Uncharacterised protein [BD1-7 clade bacterium]|uniref:Fatty acid hydroxylase domain-containing protein n=1 Tax=BD1-7 clade bacterium TaxID=2029982 RepID=A0A5S9QGY0_9GAMM|nr:Uncharacterised protein [BD1-7 clade bacterium]
MLYAQPNDTRLGVWPVFTRRSQLSLLPRKSGIPTEQTGSQALGLAVHFGPVLAFIATVLIFGRSEMIVISAFMLLSVLNLLVIVWLEEHDPSVALPTRTFDAWRKGLSLVFLKGVVAGTITAITVWALVGALLSLITVAEPSAASGWMIAGAVLATDFAYYWIHRTLNHGHGKKPVQKWFRKIHVVHHSVDVLDFLRGNVSSFFDTSITGFQVSLGVIAALMGMDLTSLLMTYAFVLQLQATHHANHTFNIGWLRFIFMDNHAHKMHHCPRGYMVNHGALFSLWDQWFGTYFEDWTLSSNYLQKHRIPLPVSQKSQ